MGGTGDRTFHARRERWRATTPIRVSLRLLWASLPMACSCLAPQHAAAQATPGAGQPVPGGTTVNLGTIPVNAPAPVTIGQQPNAEGINNYVTTRNRTGGKADLPTTLIPQDIVVVPQKVIQDQGLINRREALENVAGTAPIAQIRNGTDDGFVLIRGFPPSGFLRNGFFDGGTGINTYLPWTGDAERIEVLKGGTSLLWGPSVQGGGIGGIVNLVTKLPLPTPHYEIGGYADTYGAWSTNIDISHPLTGDGSWLGRFLGEVNDRNTFIDHFRIQQKAGNLTVQGLLDPQTSLTLIAEWIHQENQQYAGLPAYGTILPAPARSPFQSFSTKFNPSDPSSREYYDTSHLQAVLDHRFNTNWDLHTALSYNYGRRDVRQFYIAPAGNYATSGLWTEQYNHTIFTANVFSADTTLNGKFDTASLKHDFVFGFQALVNDFTTVNSNKPNNPPPSLNPVLLWGQTPGNYRIFNDTTSEFQEYTLYANDVVSLTDRLKLSGGVSFISAHLLQHSEVPATTPGVNTVSSGVGARVGPVFQLTPNLSVFADYATAFVPQFPRLQSNGQLYTNLQPLTGNQYEVGLKYELPNVASVTAAAYQLTERNVVTQDPINPNAILQSAEQRSRGLELDGQYHLAPGWDLLTALAYTEAAVTKDNSFLKGSALTGVPRYSGRLFSIYEFPLGQGTFGFGGGVTFAGSRVADIPTRTATTVGRLPGYGTLDALVYYKLAGWRASANMTNLLDKRYYYAAQNLSRVYPGEPFTALFRLSKEF